MKLLSYSEALYSERGAADAAISGAARAHSGARYNGFGDEKNLQEEILGYTIKCNEETVRGRGDSPYLF